MMMRVICSMLLLLPFRPTPVYAGQREFSSGYAGILPMDAKNLARTYFNEPAVRRLIFDMENGPLPRDRATEALKGTHFTVEDLLRVKLVCERDGRLFIGFNYFSADDINAIDRVAALFVPSLVRTYLEHRQAFDRIFTAYSASTVSSKKLAFVLIAGFSLNWDGLRTTQELGYRKPLLVQGEGWRYSFWAEEDVPDRSTKEFYWGSSTFPAGKYNFPDKPADFAFSSFGDPFSDARLGLVAQERIGSGESETSQRPLGRHRFKAGIENPQELVRCLGTGTRTHVRLSRAVNHFGRTAGLTAGSIMNRACIPANSRSIYPPALASNLIYRRGRVAGHGYKRPGTDVHLLSHEGA